MKRLFWIFMLALALPITAHASEFSVDEHAVMDGMYRSWYQGYTPTIDKNTMALFLPLRAESYTGKISVSIALDDPNVFLLSYQPGETVVSPQNGIYPVRLYIGLERYRRNGDFPATITIRGVDETGGETVETMPYILRIRDGYSNREHMEPVISEVAGQLDVGSAGSVCLTITNPTTTQSIIGGVLTLTDESGDILMSGSDRFLLPEILPGKRETVTVPVTVKADAAIAVHTLEVHLRYRALDAEAEWTENFSLPVTQEIRLEQGGVQLPTAIAGELANMTLPLMNLGRGELHNVLVRLEMDGVLDAQSVLVGTMEPGATQQAKLTFTPRTDAVGTHPGTVYIACEDAYGNPYERTLDVTLKVVEPLPEAEPEQEKETRNAASLVPILACILLAAGWLTQGTFLTRKLHKLEEERL